MHHVSCIRATVGVGRGGRERGPSMPQKSEKKTAPFVDGEWDVPRRPKGCGNVG